MKSRQAGSAPLAVIEQDVSRSRKQTVWIDHDRSAGNRGVTGRRWGMVALAVTFAAMLAVASQIGQGCSRLHGKSATMGPPPPASLHCPKLVIFGYNLLR